MTRRIEKDPERVAMQTYKNKHGAERVTALFPRSLALKIAVSDPDAIDKLVAAITERILREEAPTEEDGA